MRGKLCKKLRKLAYEAEHGKNDKNFLKDTLRKMSGLDKSGETVDYEWGTVYISGAGRLYQNMKRAINKGYSYEQIERDVHRVLAMRRRQEA